MQPVKNVIPVYRRQLEPVERYIVTAAQNATPIHEQFWASLKVAARELKAELLVIPLRYKNPTSRWTQSQANEEVWASGLRPYLWNQRKNLNRNLVLLADIKTQPTASEPLRGYEGISHGESGILGHTKLQMRVIPTPQNKFPKILTTTGAVTVPNYTDSRAGKLGEFHHTLGAVLVEIQGKIFHLRHLNASKSTGEFTDLNRVYAPHGSRKAERAHALVMGDTHTDFIDPDVAAATFGEGGMIETLNPTHLVYHDLLDAYSVNPHHAGNPFAGLAKHRQNLRDVQAEISRAVQFVVKHLGKDRKAVIVSSNHDDMVQRYMLTQDWRDDPANAVFYLKTAVMIAEAMRIGKHGMEMPSAFRHWFTQLAADSMDRIRLLGDNESFTLAGVELGMHGDRGPSGARGSARNLRRIGVKSIIGHSHSPCIEEGCYQTGTSTPLRLEYNSGPSAWLNTHCVLHADGKRQLINIIEGEWRLAN
jgi:hypothetical protein